MTGAAGVRLVQTGLDAQGRSTVVSDALVDAGELATGRVLHALWRSDAVPGAPHDGVEPGLFPAAGGARFWVFTVRAHEPDSAAHGLHRTPTVDLGLVISGALTMELEDGTTVDLNPGDAYVQNGTLHAWHNRGDVDATIVLSVLGL